MNKIGWIALVVGIIYLLFPRFLRSIHWARHEADGWKPIENHPLQSLWLYRIGGIIAIIIGLEILTGLLDFHGK